MVLYKENYGNDVSMGQIMLAAGYSKSSAENPKVLTDSQDWQDMMEEFLPDKLLLKKHKQLLEAKKIERIEFPAYVTQETIRAIILDAGCKPRNFETNPFTGIISVWYWAPDARAQQAALTLAYHLKGKMKLKVERTDDVPVALVEFLGDDDTSDSNDPVS